MSATIESKHGLVALPAEQLYMGFTDMRNLTQNVPQEYRDSVVADFDNLTATVHGMTISVRIVERRPYSLIRIEDVQAPIHFSVSFHFDSVPGGTDFSIVAEADINAMMKAVVGHKIKKALDQIVDGLVAVSHGQKPEYPSDRG